MVKLNKRETIKVIKNNYNKKVNKNNYNKIK